MISSRRAWASACRTAHGAKDNTHDHRNSKDSKKK
jgi:hypothetical protein